MASKFIHVQIVACIISIAFGNLIPVPEGNNIKVTVGTASFCGDTVAFITNQLVPTYELYKDFLEVEFIPWGRATLEEDGTVTCLAGINDCWANRLHRCVLNSLKADQDARMRYMACEFSRRPAFVSGSYECVQEIGLNLIEIDYCVNNPAMDNLDADAHDAVKEAMDKINFVPSIVFNDQVDVNLHTTALQRFHSLICLSLSVIPEAGITSCPV